MVFHIVCCKGGPWVEVVVANDVDQGELDWTWLKQIVWRKWARLDTVLVWWAWWHCSCCSEIFGAWEIFCIDSIFHKLVLISLMPSSRILSSFLWYILSLKNSQHNHYCIELLWIVVDVLLSLVWYVPSFWCYWTTWKGLTQRCERILLCFHLAWIHGWDLL